MVLFVRNSADNAEEMGMTLAFRRRSQVAVLAEILVFLPFFLAWLPGWAKFILDVVWVWMTVLAVRFRDAGTSEGLKLWVILGLAVSAAVYLTRFQSVLYYLWGVRNNFRFYGAFFGFALLSDREREEIWRGLAGLFWVNFWLSIIQFFGFGLKGDYLGGLFGTEKGCNGASNLFFLVVAARSLVLAGEGREMGGVCLAKCAAALLAAALAELKFFFVEFGLILLILAVFGEKGKAVLWRQMGAFLALFVGIGVLYRCFPEFEGWLHPEKMLKTAGAKTGYASVGDLNRLNAFSEIDRRVFTAPWQKVFGLGLGNCDYSSGFDFLTSPFYRWYEGLHYSWMSHAFWYLEGGWVGVVFFFGFFVGIVLGQFHASAKLLAAMCLLVGVYNSSLRTEAAYVMYFALSEPFGRQK